MDHTRDLTLSHVTRLRTAPNGALRAAQRASAGPTRYRAVRSRRDRRRPLYAAFLLTLLLALGDQGGPFAAAHASGTGTLISARNSIVQVEYQGTLVTTSVSPLDGAGHVVKTVSTVHWDFVWAGTLDELLFPTLHGSPQGNTYAPRLLTGTVATDYPPHMGDSCTGELSLGRRGPGTDGNGPVTRTQGALHLSATTTSSDRTKIGISSVAPDTSDVLQSNSKACPAETASNGVVDSRHLLLPDAIFSLANLTRPQTRSFSGNERSVYSGETHTTTVRSTITFSGAACGGASGLTPLFACYVALGDSYSAGQMPPFVPGGAPCARSTLAYPYRYDRNGAFQACTGATIDSVIGDQLYYVLKTTRLVSITIGGNDTGLFGTLELCLLHSVSARRCAETFRRPNFAALLPRLVALYQQIHALAPAARIVVLGYPNPMPATVRSGCSALYIPGTRIGVFPSDAVYFHGLIEGLNATIQRAVRAVPSATFVSPEPVFVGHDICSRSSYFFPLEIDDVLETLHPNAEGQAQLAALLRRAAGPPPD